MHTFTVLLAKAGQIWNRARKLPPLGKCLSVPVLAAMVLATGTTAHADGSVAIGEALSKIPYQPDGPWVSTESGEEYGSKVANIVQGRIAPSAGPGLTYDAATMWHSAKSPTGWVAVQVAFPHEVELTRLAVHSQHSGEYHAAQAIRVSVRDTEGRVQRVSEAELKSVDAVVDLPKTKNRVWQFEFRAGASGYVVLRGLQFFSGDEELFPTLASSRAPTTKPVGEPRPRLPQPKSPEVADKTGSPSAVQVAAIATGKGPAEATKDSVQKAPLAQSTESQGEKKEMSATGSEKTAVAPAENVSDQDDVAPCILPITGNEPVNPGAAWALGLASEPGQLLDAMEGGRPGGDVTAMMVLLRQSAGPLSEEEDEAMNKKWAPYAASKSPKAHKAIRKQSELLLRAILHRQMMIQAAWEYDFAIAQRQIAMLMKDNEEAKVAEMIAELQQQVAEIAQKNLESLNEEIDKAPEIPTPEELKAEEDAERKNAVDALELPAAPPDGKVLLGYLKHEETYSWKHIPNPYEGDQFTIDMGEKSVTYSETRANIDHGGNVAGTVVQNFKCSWELPKIFPLYGRKGAIIGNTTDAPWKVELTDAGSKPHPKDKHLMLAVRVYYEISTTAEKPEMKQSAFRTYGDAKNIILFVGEKPTNMPTSTNVYTNGRMDKYPSITVISSQDEKPRYYNFIIDSAAAWCPWWVCMRYKWDPVDPLAPPVVAPDDPNLDQEKNDAIAEHRGYIAAAERVIKSIVNEMAAEQDPIRREELRLQALHLKQDIHDSNDLIESIRTGTLVKTRGPWDEHATAVMARTSMELVEDCKRAQQMQASYIHMTKMMEKYKPDEARKLYESFRSQMVQGIYQPGGFEKAKKALDALYGSTTSEMKEAQKQNYADLERKNANLAQQDSNIAILESIKKNCDRGIFLGTLATGVGFGVGLSMFYEGACTSAEKTPKEAGMNALRQGATTLGCMGVMKAGGWAIGKFLNPKVAQSEVNSFKKILDANRYQQEMEWNQALVNRLKEKAGAMERCKAAGGKDYLKIRVELDDAVVAANSSSLAKNIMKNEFVAAEKTLEKTLKKTLAEKGVKEAAKKANAALNGINSYQKIYNKRLQNSIYPRTDAEMVRALTKQGYNVEAGWFREFRNATSRGANRDRDLGLLAQFEGKLTKNGKPVSLIEFMRDGQKAYNASYKQVTGRGAVLADQNITTSAHGESFPLKWLEQKIGEAGNPRDFGKAGSAIYNKVKNAMAGPDPAFVNLKKACSSLGKDLKTKVLPRLEKPVPGSVVSEASRKAATEHWNAVQKVMDNFASDKMDPLTAMRELQKLTGSTSVTQSAAEVQRLMIRLGGGGR